MGGTCKMASLRVLGDNEVPTKERFKMESVSKKDIAIIGMAGRFAEADSIEDYWNILKMGKDCIRNIPETRKTDSDAFLSFQGVNTEDIKYRELGYLNEIDKFDYKFFNISPKEASFMDPRQRLFLETVWGTIEDAGYGGGRLAETNTGVFASCGDDLVLDYKTLIYLVAPEMLVSSMPGNLRSIVASRISYLLDLNGPSLMVDTACSSSLVAVHLACQALKNRDCEYAIAGGVDLSLLTTMGNVKDSIGIESSNGRSKTFDDSADGTGGGEGVVAILLKPLAKAVADGDNIHGVIKGSAYNQDGRTIGITAPSPLAQEKVITKAWKDAGINPETISYIEAHGTGTDLGDPIEVEGIQRAFRNYTSRKQFCAIGSVKTNIGHLNSSAGLAGLVKCVLSLKNGKIPASLHFNTPNKKIDFENSPVYVNTRLTELEVSDTPARFGVSAFGLSGTNCHVVLEQYKGEVTQRTKNISEARTQIFALSAKSQASLKKLVEKYQAFFEDSGDTILEDICFTANTGRGHYNYRIAIPCNSVDDLKQKLRTVSVTRFDDITPVGVYFGNYKIIPYNKPIKEKGELFESDKHNLDEYAAEKLSQIIDKSYENSFDSLIEVLCSLYVQGADVKWEVLYSQNRVRKVSLPTYPFGRDRCWVEIPEVNKADINENIEEFFHKCEWQVSKQENCTMSEGIKEKILIFMDEKGIGKKLAAALRESGNDVIEVSIGESYEVQDEYTYFISENPGDYDKLFSTSDCKDINRIVHLMSITNSCSEVCTIRDLRLKLDKGVYSIFYIIKALSNNKIRTDIRIHLVSENANEVTGREKNIYPENSALYGFGKSIQGEYSNLQCSCIDIDENNISVEQLISEIYADRNMYITSYREGIRYECGFRRLEIKSGLEINSESENGIEIKTEGVYLITGGLGGIGFEICKHLARKSLINIALIGRSDLTKYQGNGTGSNNAEIYERLNEIKDLTSKGANIFYVSADVSSLEDMQLLINDLRKKYGRINGIIHSAGVAGEGFIIRKEEKEIAGVLAPKVLGTWILDNLTRQDAPDFFILFSSITSIFSGGGQSDYTAANSYIDSYAAYANRTGQNKVLSINWATWKQVGMAVNYGVNYDGIFKALNTVTAIRCFDTAVSSGQARVIIGKPDYELNRNYWEAQRFIKLSDHIKVRQEPDTILQKEVIANKEYEVEISGKNPEDISENEKITAKIWAEYMGLKEINVYDDFYEMGGDSIVATKIVNKIKEILSKNVLVSDLLDNPTVTGFTSYIEELGKEKDIKPAEDSGSYQLEKTVGFNLSNSQKRLWFLQKVNPDMIAYNVPFNIYVDYELDIEKFKMAVNLLIERHSALRTIFVEWEGIPRQVVLSDMKLDMEIIDITDSSGNGNDLDKMLDDDFKYIFNLDKPLIRIKIYRLENQHFCIHFNLHHIIIDGWSSLICQEEIIEIYNSLVENRQPKLIPLSTTYLDWVRKQEIWLESAEAEQMLSYWKDELSGVLPLLNLPFDYSRPKSMTFNGSYVKIIISAEHTTKIREMCGQLKVTPHILLLSAYIVLMHKITLDEDIIVGIPESGRYSKEIENVVGLFINTFCIRAKIDNQMTLVNILEYIKMKNLQAYDNFNYPFDLLVTKLNYERDFGRNPIFNTMFQIYQTIPPENEGASQFDLSLFCIDLNDTIEGRFEYNTNLFKKETIESISNNFCEVLNALLDNKEIRIRDIKFNNVYTVEKEDRSIKEEIDFAFS